MIALTVSSSSHSNETIKWELVLIFFFVYSPSCVLCFLFHNFFSPPTSIYSFLLMLLYNPLVLFFIWFFFFRIFIVYTITWYMYIRAHDIRPSNWRSSQSSKWTERGTVRSMNGETEYFFFYIYFFNNMRWKWTTVYARARYTLQLFFTREILIGKKFAHKSIEYPVYNWNTKNFQILKVWK